MKTIRQHPKECVDSGLKLKKKKKEKLNSAFSTLLRLLQTTGLIVDDKEGGG